MSSGTSAFPPVLNPEEPFAYLSPDVAHQLHIAQIVIAAVTGMFTWEIVLDAYNVYRMLFKSRPSIPSIVYILSRASTLTFLVSILQFLTVGAGDCKRLITVVSACWTFASSLTAMLFLFRIWALFRGRATVVAFFSFLWLCVVGGAMAVGFANPPVSHLLPSNSFCVMISYPLFAGAGLIIPAVFDTLVFFAISLRLFPSYEMESHMGWKERVVFFFRGDGLPRLSKALLQGGQQYYLLSVIVNIFSLAFYFSSELSGPHTNSYHILVTPILISLINSMACKVYCDIKFGAVQAAYTTSLLSNIVFPPLNGGSTSLTASLPAPQVAVPPDAITMNKGTIHRPVSTDVTELNVIIGTKDEQRNSEYSENMRERASAYEPSSRSAVLE